MAAAFWSGAAVAPHHSAIRRQPATSLADRSWEWRLQDAMDVRSPASSVANGAERAHGYSRRENYLRFVPTLLRKNWLLKKKHPVALAFEVLTPVIFIVLMAAIRTTSHDKTVPAGFTLGTQSYNLYSPGGTSLIAPYYEVDVTPVASPPLLAVPETTMSGLLLHFGYLSFLQARRMDSFDTTNKIKCLTALTTQGMVSLNESSQYAVPDECEGRVSPFKLAIVPDTPFTRGYFFDTVKQWYPTVTLDMGNASDATLVIPSLEDSVVFYDSEEELEDYITSKEYAATAKHPRIFGAIVFEMFPGTATMGTPASIEYAVRLNGTYVGDDPDVRYVPRTNAQKDASLWNAYKRKLETLDYQQYTTNGFLTLQTLVTRFANCLPDWDTTTQTTTGKCQVNASAAILSDELESRLLQVAANDPATNFAVSLYNSFVTTDEVTDASAAINMNLAAETRQALLQPLLQAPQPILGALTTPFPINTFRSSSFYDAVSDVFPIFFVIAYIHPLSKVLVSLISERETRSRELMKILGVNDSCIVISWYITYIAIFLVGSILQTIAASINLFPSSSVLLLFLFFFLFSLSVLAFGFLVSSVFSKARTGTYVGFIGFFILYAVSNAFTESSPESSKALACLLAPVGLVFGVQSLADAETSHVGVSLTGSINNFTFATALIFFAIDTALYTLLGIYLEKVVPKEFGTTEKWYFPFKPSYWRKSAAKAAVVATPRRPLISNDDKMETDAEVEQEDDYRLDLAANIEPVSSDLLDQERRGDALVVNGLCKQFPVPGGIKEAVKNLHVTMYAGQITCLLGHNGAGKTTLISMLTGVTAPTSGDATIHGLSLREDIASIRESLGICFQHDVLYPELTVRDHLEFYARIKGFSGDEINAEVESKIKEVGLGDKRDTIASALSGGMKRKLSVAISLLGDSSLVFLDEPTSGMDPYSRRSIWEVLLSNRRNRVMVLTTHFMDEADILGDRIAIMAEGELRCCGSALFLKNRYGVGYNLTMVKKQDRNSDSDDESETGAAAIEFITQRIPSAKVLSNVGAEVAFQLPLDASSLFPKLFRDLDARLDKLSLRSYGISVTTMEEVFIKVAEAATEDFNRHLAATNGHQAEGTQKDKSSKTATDDYVCLVDGTSDDSSATSFDPATQNSGNHRMFFVQSAALLQKRIRIAKRDRKMFVVGLALPIIWLIIGLSLVKVGDITKSDPSMPLTLDKLPSKTKTGTILLPSYCESDVDTNGWCASSLVSADSGDEIRTVSLSQDVVGSPAYSTDSPTVFNVTYSNPSVNASDATGYQLRLSQVIHSRAFSSGIADQFGGYLIHADSDARQFGYNLLVNTTLVHAAAVFKARIDESLFQLMMSEFESSTASSLTLKVSNHPLPLTRDARALFTSFLSFSACMFIVIAFAYYPASIVVQLVRERFPEKNAKHQQLVAGAGIPAFWAANYVFDMVVFLVPCIVALVLLQVYDLGSFTGGSSCVTCSSSTFTSVIILFIAFGLAVIPYAYCWSFVFRDPPSSQTYMIMINFVIGLALMIVSFTMQVISDSTKDVDDALQFIWRLSPLFCLGRGLLNLTIIEITHLAYQLEDQISTDPFALENTGWPLIYLIFDAILYTAIAVAADYAKSFPSIKESVFARYLPRWAQSKIPDNDDDATQAEAIDEDVAAETERVLCNNGGSTDVVELRNLRKVYHSKHKGEAKTTVAVKKLTFGLPRGECFGFLGINGAGKTTTMKMLTGDVAPTAGSALLAGGLDIQTQQLAIRRQIGYCPQFDALMDLLTVREHLELFAKIKGISPHSRVVSEVDSKMEQLGLVEFADRLAGSLSGGNKRKLSVAIALMGEPPIIFLDEPSTGMDPVSRRFMWDVIARQSTRRKQSTVVLTTHSMEECEALCSRVGIMVSGSLQCLGSVQHLKNRFGDGVLMFDAKLSPPEPSKVHRLALTHFDKTDARISTRQQLLDACTRLGDASWADKIDKNHPTGYALADQLDRSDELDGGISALALAEWWLAESQFEAVAEFLDENFGAGAELLERKHDSCWFKLKPDSSGALRLANVFEVVEHAKARLAIREYSVSQTTLEQIFNSFASKQPREME